jgi:hypothetical protein
MKKIGLSLLSALFLIAVFNSRVMAQSDFEQELTSLHKKAIMTCSIIKKPEVHKQSEMLQALDELKMQVFGLQKKYADYQPAGYENDPLWKSYFMEFNDIINALQTRVGNGNYKPAAMNCSRFCMLFDKIHTVNGHVDLTDMMFRWFSQTTMTTNMVNATNYEDAMNNLKQVKILHKKVLEFERTSQRSDESHTAFDKINELYNQWVKALESRDYQLTVNTYKKFQDAFGKAFIMSLN